MHLTIVKQMTLDSVGQSVYTLIFQIPSMYYIQRYLSRWMLEIATGNIPTHCYIREFTSTTNQVLTIVNREQKYAPNLSTIYLLSIIFTYCLITQSQRSVRCLCICLTPYLCCATSHMAASVVLANMSTGMRSALASGSAKNTCRKPMLAPNRTPVAPQILFIQDLMGSLYVLTTVEK